MFHLQCFGPGGNHGHLLSNHPYQKQCTGHPDYLSTSRFSLRILLLGSRFAGVAFNLSPFFIAVCWKFVLEWLPVQVLSHTLIPFKRHKIPADSKWGFVGTPHENFKCRIYPVQWAPAHRCARVSSATTTLDCFCRRCDFPSQEHKHPEKALPGSSTASRFSLTAMPKLMACTFAWFSMSKMTRSISLSSWDPIQPFSPSTECLAKTSSSS